MDERTTRMGIALAALAVTAGVLIAEVIGRGLPVPVGLSTMILCIALVWGVADELR